MTSEAGATQPPLVDVHNLGELLSTYDDSGPPWSAELTERVLELVDEGQRAQEFPAPDLSAALRAFRRPFSPAAVKWKVEIARKASAVVVPYIDARLVIERLNLIWPWWTEQFDGNAKELWCYLTLLNRPLQSLTLRGLVAVDSRDGAISHSGCGSGSFLKAAESDARKRAAVPFGIGVSVYAIPKAMLDRENDEHKDRYEYWHTAAKDGKPERHNYRLTNKGEKALRDFYEKWLKAKGETAFGPVLDHGDDEDSAGDFEAAAAPEGQEGEAPATAGMLVDERADQLRQRARETYARVGKKPALRQALPPARFKTRLEEASVSHDALEALVGELNGMLDG